jgi:hypothetical protein
MTAPTDDTVHFCYSVDGVQAAMDLYTTNLGFTPTTAHLPAFADVRRAVKGVPERTCVAPGAFAATRGGDRGGPERGDRCGPERGGPEGGAICGCCCPARPARRAGPCLTAEPRIPARAAAQRAALETVWKSSPRWSCEAATL